MNLIILTYKHKNHHNKADNYKIIIAISLQCCGVEAMKIQVFTYENICFTLDITHSLHSQKPLKLGRLYDIPCPQSSKSVASHI